MRHSGAFFMLALCCASVSKQDFKQLPCFFIIIISYIKIAGKTNTTQTRLLPQEATGTTKTRRQYRKQTTEAFTEEASVPTTSTKEKKAPYKSKAAANEN
jgi:hypothetical protein